APLIRVRTAAPAGDAPAAGESRTSVLVGYGPGAEAPTRRRPASKNGAAAPHSAAPGRSEEIPPEFPARPPATPAARQLARELGINIAFVAGSGPGGAVTVEDVRHAVPVSQPPRRVRPEEDAADAPR